MQPRKNKGGDRWRILGFFHEYRGFICLFEAFWEAQLMKMGEKGGEVQHTEDPSPGGAGTNKRIDVGPCGGCLRRLEPDHRSVSPNKPWWGCTEERAVV
jgi:hypothetical protein